MVPRAMEEQMPQYRIRVVRVRRAVQDGFVTVTANNSEEAVEAAFEVDSETVDWRTQDASTEHWDVDTDSIKEEEAA